MESFEGWEIKQNIIKLVNIKSKLMIVLVDDYYTWQDNSKYF